MLSTVLNYIWFFFIYAFLGWCTEVCFSTCARGRFENRGFLNGPLCPIYGFGVVAVVLLLKPLKNDLVLLFVGSVVVTSVLELITGFLMEKIFKHRWWDYSNKPLNIGGYICLPFSLAWGLACVVLIDLIHPSIAFAVNHIPHIVSYIALAIMIATLLVDAAATSAAVFHFNRNLSEIEKLAQHIHEISDNLGRHLSDSASRIYHSEKVASLKELKEDLNRKINSTNFIQRRLVKAFPNMKSTKHFYALNKVRDALKRKKDKKK